MEMLLMLALGDAAAFLIDAVLLFLFDAVASDESSCNAYERSRRGCSGGAGLREDGGSAGQDGTNARLHPPSSIHFPLDPLPFQFSHLSLFFLPNHHVKHTTAWHK
jgi:hypothetical protein